MSRTSDVHFADLLRGGFKSLGYFMDEACASHDSYTFFRLIADLIVPLVRKAPAFEPLFLEWMKEKACYKTDYARMEKAAISEISSTYRDLRLEIPQNDLAHDDAVNSSMTSIEDLLEFREVYLMPAYYEVANDRIQRLLRSLLSKGKHKLVATYAEFATDNNSPFAMEHAPQKIQQPQISSYSFAPSFERLKSLNQVFSWENHSDPWIVWEFIELAHWCWHTPFSYFEEKKFEYGSSKRCLENGYFENLRAHWIEMNGIKKHTHSWDKLLFFKRERFLGYLKDIVHQAILYQEIYGVNEMTRDTQSPYALELKLAFGKLILKVEWFEGDKPEDYVIHRFTDDSNNQDFTNELLNSKPNTSVQIDKNASGATISKYLSRTKLKDTLLADIFFIDRTTYKMALRSTRVQLIDFPDINLKKLRDQIKQFDLLDKGWSL